jgi:hypothetical protein
MEVPIAMIVRLPPEVPTRSRTSPVDAAPLPPLASTVDAGIKTKKKWGVAAIRPSTHFGTGAHHTG